jgi:hypothetical protein
MARRKIYDKEIQLNPFFDLNDDEFEDLCRDLFGKSNEVVHARKLFGKGYEQFGGDILVQIDDATSYLVQCKHYPKASFSRSDIEEAVNLFTSHWETHWKKHKVKRFYLAVSRPVTTDDQLSTIREQIERLLNDFEITFVYLEQDDLRRELKPHRDLVREYLDEYWWERICAPETDTAAKGFVNDSIGDRLQNRNFEQMASLLSEKTKNEIEPIRHLARCGKRKEAVAKFFELKQKSFDYLDAKTRAELLSLELRLRFPHEINTPEARQLIEQIHQEDKDFQTLYLEALLTAQEKGFVSALEKLTVCPDVSTFNLKMSFLINSENYEEVSRLYESEVANLAYDTETKRLYALALLALGENQKAEDVIVEAVGEQPDWEGVRLAKAIILYYSSQASQILLENPLAFPQPRPWNLIKIDGGSRQKRREAAQIFKDILASERADKEEIQIFQSWYLACLADDAERRPEAANYAQTILETQPTHPYVLIWALGRNIPVDFPRSKFALEEKFKRLNAAGEKAAINEALILLPLYLRDGESTKAKRHLLKIKSQLENLGEKDLFAFWECQIALVKGEADVIEKRLAQKIKNIELRQSIQISALLAAYQMNPNRANRRNYGKRLAKICRKSQDPQYLALYCQFCHFQKNWQEVIKYGFSLLNKIPTGESLRIVCDAYYHSRQSEKCLELIESHRHFFPDGDLPNDLSRLEAHCWLNAGRPAKASEIARRVFDREKSADNLLTLVETHRHAGDWFAIKEAVEKMPSLDELTPMQQLQISRMIASIDQPLAVEMWRKVKKRAEEAREVVDAAFFFGNRLGLDDETGDLMKLMMDDRERGENNHRLLNISEWREMMRERNEHLQEVEQLYLKGKIPIHLHCEESNQALTIPFHLLPNLNRETENFRKKFKILIRGGNRIVENAELLKAKPEWRFHLDISSLLLVNHLDLLDSLEKFAPLYVTREMIPLLQSEIKQLEDQSQPSRVEAAKLVLRTLADGKCQRLKLTKSLSSAERGKYKSLINRVGERDICLMLQAAEEQALVIDYLPLRNSQNGKAVKTPPEFQQIVRGWQSVVSGLLDEGLLPAHLADKCRLEIKKKDNDEFLDTKPLPVGSHLYLTGLTAQQMAKIGIFSEVCQNYQVFLDERNEQILINEQERYEQGQELILWLRNLQERLKKGFEHDIYRGISDERLKDEPEARNRKFEDYRMRSILELLLLDGTGEDAVAVDDRWMSGYLSLNHQTPLLTIYEILLTLKAHGHLSNDEYYEKLRRLRDENFRYLPVTKDEILYHLERAGETQKSPELSTLRKYLAECFLDERWLQKPAIPARRGNYAELEFVFASQRAAVEAIGHVWSESESIEAAHRRADTLLFDFYTGWFGLRHFFPEELVHQAGAWHLASDFTYFCVQGMGILANSDLSLKERKERLGAYFYWISYIFKEYLHSNSAFVERTVEYLVAFLAHSSDEAQTDEQSDETVKAARQTIIAMEMLLVNHLPEKLRKPLLENEFIKRKFKFTPETIYSVGEMQFRGDELWNAVAQALRGEKAQVRWKNNDEEILEVKRGENSQTRPEVDLCRADGSTISLKDAVIGILLPEYDQRLDFALSNRNSFDCSDDDFLVKLEEILAVNEPLERVGALNDWSKNSAQIAYENLALEIEQKKGFSGQQLSEFPLAGLLNHFRLSAELSDKGSFGQEFTAAGECLLQEQGLETALERSARFPVSIPERLIEELGNLPFEERKSLIEKFRQNWRSPVGKLHYLSLVLRALPEDSESLGRAREEAKTLFKNEKEILGFEIFKSLLMLASEEFSREPAIKNWALPVRLSLTWAHAARLYDIISPLADNEEEKRNLLKYLNSARPFWSREIFACEPEFWRDCLHPRLLERQSFLGLAAGSLFAGLPEELMEKLDLLSVLRELCFIDMDEKIVPHYSFWKDFGNRGNATESFLGARGFALFNLLSLSKKEVLVFQQESVWESLKSLIESIIENPVDSASWVKLIFITDGLPLNSALHKDFFRAVGNLDFQAIWEDDDESALAILSFLADQKAILSNELQSQIESWLRWAVGKLDEKYPAKLYPNSNGRLEQENIAVYIAEIAARLTLEPFDPITSSQRWNQLIYELAQIWSNLPILLEPAFLRLWLGLPVEQLQGIGKNLLLAKVSR